MSRNEPYSIFKLATSITKVTSLHTPQTKQPLKILELEMNPQGMTGIKRRSLVEH